jgi:hypothetical protein
MQTVGRGNMTKLTVTFRNFAKEPKAPYCAVSSSLLPVLSSLDPNILLSTLLSSTLKTYVLPSVCQMMSHTDISRQYYSTVCLNLYVLRKGKIQDSGPNTRGPMPNFNPIFISLRTQFYIQSIIKKILKL